MENYKYASFPIDNKNIMEDFTEAIHNNECIEYRFKRVVKQAFYHRGLLFELQYILGDSIFSVTTNDVSYYHKESMESIRDKIVSLEYPEYGLHVFISELSNGFICQFRKEID